MKKKVVAKKVVEERKCCNQKVRKLVATMSLKIVYKGMLK